MRIVVFCATYLPGFKAGGPVRSIAALVERLGNEFDFRIITSDRDVGDLRPYTSVEVGRWVEHGAAHVFYARRQQLQLPALASIIRNALADAYHVNSFFSPLFGIQPVIARWSRLMPQRPLVLAPRGEFSPGALAIKRPKKRAFIALARRLPAYEQLIWHASTEQEADDIRREMGQQATVRVAGNLAVAVESASVPKRPKEPGELSLAFVSRISPKKNLAFALRLLGRLRGRVVFHIYGPRSDERYAAHCEEIARGLPAGVQVRFEGEVPHSEVGDRLRAHHAFLLPTLGENFGHAILEALLAGCVVVLSDTTPWLHLGAAGWALPLSMEAEFVAALQECVDMDSTAFERRSRAAHQLGERRLTDAKAIEQHRELFLSLRQ